MFYPCVESISKAIQGVLGSVIPTTAPKSAKLVWMLVELATLYTLAYQLRSPKLYGRNGALFGHARPPQHFPGGRKHKNTSKNKKLCSAQTLGQVQSVLSSKTHQILAGWTNPQRSDSRNRISTFSCLKLNKKFALNKVFCFWKSSCVS